MTMGVVSWFKYSKKFV